MQIMYEVFLLPLSTRWDFLLLTMGIYIMFFERTGAEKESKTNNLGAKAK